MATVAEKLITVEEFMRMPDPPDGSRQELVRGVVITMPPPFFKHGLRQGRAYSLVDNHARSKHLGRVTVESGLITERDPDTVRGPDVAYWSYERLPEEIEPEGYPDVAADLCIEVLSSAKEWKRMREKLLEYFARGVRMVWVINPEDRTVTVYRNADEGRVLHENANLTGDEVLPGFACKVAELFA